MHEIITSSQNPRVQLVRSLLNQPKARRKQLAFTAEGSRLVEDGLRSSLPVQFLLVRDGHSSRVEELLAGLAPEFPIFTVETQLFDSLSETEISQGILAVFELPKPNPPTQPDFLLILDQVRDPGNLGTILRSAEAAGVQAVCLAPGTTDPWAPKVVRSGMGAHFRLSVLQLGWQQLHQMTRGLAVFQADMNGALTCWQVDFTGSLALLIGGEAEGISPEGVALATQSVRIPMVGQSESLNAAVSASVLLFEVLRQRSGGSPA